MPKYFECLQCGQKFTALYLKRAHVCEANQELDSDVENETDDQSRCSALSCDICGLGFEKRKLLFTHIQDAHREPDTKRYFCNKCGKTFSRLADLKKHILRVHKGQSNVYICPICSDKIFENYQDLRDHIFCSHNIKEGNNFFRQVQNALKNSVQTFLADIETDMKIASFDQLKVNKKILDSLTDLLQKVSLQLGTMKFAICVIGKYVKIDNHNVIYQTEYLPLKSKNFPMIPDRVAFMRNIIQRALDQCEQRSQDLTLNGSDWVLMHLSSIFVEIVETRGVSQIS